MGSDGAAPPVWLQFLPLIVVAVIVTIRLIRPQRISVTRMWVQPIILAAIAAWAIYAGNILNPAPVWEIAAGLGIGLVVGVPFGILRGVHTDVMPTQKPGVMRLGSSWVTALIYVAAFGGRAIVRAVMPHRGSLSGVVGDGLLAFAIAFIITSYVAIYRKYEAELAAGVPPVADPTTGSA
jgi:hypothetical protein